MLMEMWGVSLDCGQVNSLTKRFPGGVGVGLSEGGLKATRPCMTNCQTTFRVQITFTKQQKRLLIKEKWSFLFFINIKQLLNQEYTKILLSQQQHWKIFKINNYKYRFPILKTIVFLTKKKLLGQTTTQPLSYIEP